MLGLGLLSKRYRGWGLTEVSWYLFVHMEKQLGWAGNLGGAESLGISRARQRVLARLVGSQIWHLPVGSVALVGEGSEKGHGPLPAIWEKASP